MAISAGTAFIKILADFKDFGRSVESGLRKNSASFSKAGKSLTKYVTLPILAAGAASVMLAKNFETSMTRIQALAGQSQQQVSQWGEEILAMAPKLGRAPQELADALYFVASSGIDASKAMGVVEVSAKAAAVGLGDTQTVADAVTSAMNAYATSGLTAAEATDTLVEAVRLGKGEASAIAPVLGQILPVASELGVTFSDVSAGLAAMTTTGIDAAEGATRMRAIMSSLLKVTPQSAEAFENVGLSADSLRKSLSTEGLLPTLQKIEVAVGDDTDALANMFPNVRALQGVLALVGNNAENVSRIFADMADSTGALDDAFKITQQDSAFKMQQAFAQLQAAAIGFGEILLPIVTNIVNVFGELFGAITDLGPAAKSLVIAFAGVASAVGPVLYLFGKLPGIIATAKLGFTQLTAFLSNPYFLTITAVIATIYGISKAFGAAGERAKQFEDAIRSSANEFVDAMSRITNEGDAQQLVRRLLMIQTVMGTLLKQNDVVGKATGKTGQVLAHAFRTGSLSANQLVFSFQALGLTGADLRDRVIGIAGAMEEVDVSALIDGLRNAGVNTKKFNADLVVLINNMAERGVLSSVEYTDALLKAGVPMDIIKQKVKNMSDSLTDTAQNIDATGKAIHIFTFSTAKDFNEWVVNTEDNFNSFIEGQQSLKKAFSLTTAKFKKELELQAQIAEQGAKDLKTLMNAAVPDEFVQFLVDKGPEYVHAFVEGSKPEREALKKYWEDVDTATGKYDKTLGDLGDVTVSTPVDADTKPARDNINNLMEDLKRMGFALQPNGEFTVGGQLRHGGGWAGAGMMKKGPLKPDEVPSILQRGEFVIQRAIAQQPGMMKFLEALNSGRGIGEFHTGGAVGGRENLIEMQGLMNAVQGLKYAYGHPPTAVMPVEAKLPTASELIEKLIGSIQGVGGGGISPNAARYAAVIRAMFGNLQMGFTSRRFIAGTTTWSQHAFGNAVDVMTGTNDMLRKSVADFSNANRTMLSIAHLLADPWYKSPLGNHYNHVHADFNPQGTGTPPPGGGWIGARHGFHGRLSQGTNIRAHAGERVDISPRGTREPLTLRILDWKNGIAQLAGELDWNDWKSGRR